MKKSRKRFHYFSVLVFGLGLSQLLSTLHLFYSNQILYQKILSISKAGYLAIPNDLVLGSLLSIKTAFLGGIFSTLTIGGGLTIFSLTAARLWVGRFSKRLSILAQFLVIWIVALIAINIDGFNLWASFYIFILPPVIFFVATIGSSSKTTEPTKILTKNRIIHGLLLTLPTILWLSLLGNQTFLDIRDTLMFSNPIGNHLNDFYYGYTLYPAEVIKPFNLKTLKTCNIQEVSDHPEIRSIKQALLANDIIPLNETPYYDLEIIRKKNHLVFMHQKNKILENKTDTFLANPEKMLHEFSGKIDKHQIFRYFIFFSLILTSPILFYLILYRIFFWLTGIFLSKRHVEFVTPICCVIIIVALLMPIYRFQRINNKNKTIKHRLASDQWQEHVVAFRKIYEEKLDVRKFLDASTIGTATNTAEKYWLAKAYRFSKHPDSFSQILRMLDETNINVICQALFVLGKWGNSKAIQPVLHTLKTSDSWYVQWYAYRALKDLGWRQGIRK